MLRGAVVVLLTFLTCGTFYVLTPDAPLGLGATVVVLTMWAILVYGVAALWHHFGNPPSQS